MNFGKATFCSNSAIYPESKGLLVSRLKYRGLQAATGERATGPILR
jgi:hypothetical protein